MKNFARRTSFSTRASCVAALAAIILVTAQCGPERGGLTVVINGCPGTIAQGEDLQLESRVSDADGLDVTANAVFVYTLTSGTTMLTIVTDANVGTATIPEDAELGTYVITASATVAGEVGTTLCTFTVTPGDGGGSGPAQTFPTSLHNTRIGKRTFHEGTEADPGFYTMTDVPYEDLTCQDCHAATLADGTPVDPESYQPSCADCHPDPGNPTPEDVTPSICLGCHGRQAAEIGLANNDNFPLQDQMQDVHRDAGMVCMDCHGEAEMHGTGQVFTSLLDADAPRPLCEDCHVAGGSATPPSAGVTEHLLHMENIDCAACHVQSVVACYCCHFETELALDFKRFYGPPPQAGFTFLVNRVDRNKVYTATFQTLTYEDNAFAVVAPFYSHTVSAQGRTCGDCHVNAAVKSYTNDGFIQVTSWDGEKLVGPSGVIPVPPDWQDPQVWRLDYVTYVPEDLSPTDPPFIPTNWTLMEPGEELRQMLRQFSTPLTAEQMTKLALPVGGS